jgi:hypothetical protein
VSDTSPVSTDPAGVIAGSYYEDSSHVQHAFLRISLALVFRGLDECRQTLGRLIRKDSGPWRVTRGDLEG